MTVVTFQDLKSIIFKTISSFLIRNSPHQILKAGVLNSLPGHVLHLNELNDIVLRTFLSLMTISIIFVKTLKIRLWHHMIY